MAKLTELYEALLDAGASEETATKAAEAVAAVGTRLAATRRTLTLHTYLLGLLIMLWLSILLSVP